MQHIKTMSHLTGNLSGLNPPTATDPTRQPSGERCRRGRQDRARRQPQEDRERSPCQLRQLYSADRGHWRGNAGRVTKNRDNRI